MFRLTFASILLVWLALPAAAQLTGPGSVQVYVTARDTGQRLARTPDRPMAASGQPQEWEISLFVDPKRRFQTIEGIGGALTDAAAETFAGLSPTTQAEFLTAYFDPVKGLGYSLGRTNLNSCDFSSASYAYAPEGDKQLKQFDIAPDLRYKIPFIKRVRGLAPNLKLFASPWSPPAWMKSNQTMLGGGKLKSEYFATWAQYYVKFVQAFAAQGIPIWGLTVQNEPLAEQTWESCIYTADEERDFVKNFLGPALHDAGLQGVKLMIWDHNRGLLYHRGMTVLDDPEAARYVWGTAYHWYDGEQFGNLDLLHAAHPDKALLFTEGCAYPFSWDTMQNWEWGETYAKSMLADFNHWANGWCDWNILLDYKGGPNHVENYCFAPVHADQNGRLHYMNSFYYIGHFSRFVRPGAVRVACSCSRDFLPTTAFQNEDGSVVAVVLNDAEQEYKLKVWRAGRAAEVPLPARSIITLVWPGSSAAAGADQGVRRSPGRGRHAE